MKLDSWPVMKKISTLLFIVIAAVLIFALNTDKSMHNVTGSADTKNDMKLTSPAFNLNGVIPALYTCQDIGTNPPLRFENVPIAAKSLALILEDPDAPGGTYIHWVLFNISPTEKGIDNGLYFLDKQDGINSTGETGYTPPCPPSGTHQYHFKLYALDSMLNLQGHPNRDTLINSMQGHIVAQAELVGLVSQ